MVGVFRGRGSRGWGEGVGGGLSGEKSCVTPFTIHVEISLIFREFCPACKLPVTHVKVASRSGEIHQQKKTKTGTEIIIFKPASHAHAKLTTNSTGPSIQLQGIGGHTATPERPHRVSAHLTANWFLSGQPFFTFIHI